MSIKKRWETSATASFAIWSLVIAGHFVFGGCNRYREDLDYSYSVQQTWAVEELYSGRIVQFESVFWEPDDTVSLRKAIVDDAIADGRAVLEIGTGTGLIAIMCAQGEAGKVVATDINPAAVANAKYNAAVLVPDQKVDVRQVAKDSPGAFAVIKPNEKFDLIISNPPWEDGVIAKPADHAFYDPGFALMESLLDGLPKHLKPGGRCLLAYGHTPAVKRLIVEAEKRGYALKILDDRDVDSLPKDFLPGMLIELRPPLDATIVSGGQFKTVGSSPSADKDKPTDQPDPTEKSETEPDQVAKPDQVKPSDPTPAATEGE